MPIDRQAVDALLTRARREVDDGLLPSCQLALAYRGELVAFETFAGSSKDAGNETRYAVFSVTKAFIAGVVWQLIGEGSLLPDGRAAELVPEFGTNGKGVVTIEQLLGHTGGFPHAPLGPRDWATRAARLERFARWRLNWEPGTRYEYHATSAHWVLAEVIDRLTGGDYRAELRRRIVEPLGLGFELGVPLEAQGDIAEFELVGEPATADELERVFGVRVLPVTEVNDATVTALHNPASRVVGVPGGGGVARAADLALYFQALLDDRLGLWDPTVLADATGRVRTTFPDPMGGYPANRTLGLVQAGGDGHAARRGFGRTVSPRAFGHNGAGGQLAWADPASGLSFAYLTNGFDRHVLRQGRRNVALASLAGRCAPNSVPDR